MLRKSIIGVTIAIVLVFSVVASAELIRIMTGSSTVAGGAAGSAYNAKSISTIGTAANHYRIFGGSIQPLSGLPTAVAVQLKCAVNTAAGIVDNNSIIFRIDNATTANTRHSFDFAGHAFDCPDNASLVLQTVGDNATTWIYNIQYQETRVKK